MATIRKRGASWQVQVRREGHPPISKSFARQSEAAAWARSIETQIDRAERAPSNRDLDKTTVADLLTRYESEVTPTKRGERAERSRLKVLQRHPISELCVGELSGAAAAKYRDDRLKLVKPASVRRELVILRHMFEVAKAEWNMPLRSNPVHAIKLPKDSKPRDRRLAPDEEGKLIEAIGERSAWYLRPFILLAVETGMRRGELLSVRWRDVDVERRTVKLAHTKNGDPRTVPLSPRALEVLSSLVRTEERVFPIKANALRLAWGRLRKRVGMEDLRLHDLRHEAVSRFFEHGLSTPEVALISGHRDPRMLFRYAHPRPEDIAQKLNRAG
ncbi:site-specific integrase [Microvirga alba]|uniref:Site-specific integrase n=1 Tax=Microvirga alba TaxID=2791025 RepID=A0A931BRA3_9HYPH|nr:site-specific integrase [Microvirga alba]MBF9233324.1 site-specific integrase [Microvirga alba]